MVSTSLARRLSSSTTFSLPGRISYWACQPASGFTPMRANSWRRAFSFGDRPSAAALPRLAGSLSLLLEPLVGRSRMWPILDFTTYWLPRYLLMVLALAGDSTMTSDLPMDWRIPEYEKERISSRAYKGTAIYSGCRVAVKGDSLPSPARSAPLRPRSEQSAGPSRRPVRPCRRTSPAASPTGRNRRTAPDRPPATLRSPNAGPCRTRGTAAPCNADRVQVAAACRSPEKQKPGHWAPVFASTNA